jgi:hypothetical protein
VRPDRGDLDWRQGQLDQSGEGEQGWKKQPVRQAGAHPEDESVRPAQAFGIANEVAGKLVESWATTHFHPEPATRRDRLLARCEIPNRSTRNHVVLYDAFV